MQYFKELLTALRDIATSITNTNKKQNEILEKLVEKYDNISVWTSWCITIGSMEWQNVISSNLVEDSRDIGVMIDRKKAVKIIAINGKAEKTETFTREASLSKEEKAHYKKHGIVLIVNI